MSARLRAAIQSALDALEDGAYWLAGDILLAALDDYGPDERYPGAHPTTAPKPDQSQEGSWAYEGGTAP